MTIPEYFVVFPEGEIQEIAGQLRIGQLVDLNGQPLGLPLSTSKMIAYRVTGIRKKEERGIFEVYHKLELVPASELEEWVRA